MSTWNRDAGTEIDLSEKEPIDLNTNFRSLLSLATGLPAPLVESLVIGPEHIQHPGVRLRSQRTLGLGVDLESVKRIPEGMSSGLKGVGQNARKRRVFVKQDDDPKTVDYSETYALEHAGLQGTRRHLTVFPLSHRELAFHNVMREFFGLGPHVPLTSIAHLPEHNMRLTLQHYVGGSTGAPSDYHRYVPLLHKLCLADCVLSNQDRHGGNYSWSDRHPSSKCCVTPYGDRLDKHIYLLDNNLSFVYKPGHGLRDRTPYYLSGYMDEPLDPEAFDWFRSLRTHKLAASLRRNEIPKEYALDALTAFHKIKTFLLGHSVPPRMSRVIAAGAIVRPRSSVHDDVDAKPTWRGCGCSYCYRERMARDPTSPGSPATSASSSSSWWSTSSSSSTTKYFGVPATPGYMATRGSSYVATPKRIPRRTKIPAQEELTMESTHEGDVWDIYTRSGERLGRIAYRGRRIEVIDGNEFLNDIVHFYGDDTQGAVRFFSRVVGGKHMMLIGARPWEKFVPYKFSPDPNDLWADED